MHPLLLIPGGGNSTYFYLMIGILVNVISKDDTLAVHKTCGQPSRHQKTNEDYSSKLCLNFLQARNNGKTEKRRCTSAFVPFFLDVFFSFCTCFFRVPTQYWLVLGFVVFDFLISRYCWCSTHLLRLIFLLRGPLLTGRVLTQFYKHENEKYRQSSHKVQAHSSDIFHEFSFLIYLRCGRSTHLLNSFKTRPHRLCKRGTNKGEKV